MRRWFNRRVLINKVGLSLPKEMIVSLAPSLMWNRVSGFFSALELSSACATLLSFISPASLCHFASVGASSQKRRSSTDTQTARGCGWRCLSVGQRVLSRLQGMTQSLLLVYSEYIGPSSHRVSLKNIRCFEKWRFWEKNYQIFCSVSVFLLPCTKKCFIPDHTFTQ